MRIVLLFICFVLLVPAHACFALERFPIITTEEMQQLLLDRQAGKTDFLLVNSLGEMIYLHAAIPGSINIPLCKIDTDAHKLGRDKEKLIVTY